MTAAGFSIRYLRPAEDLTPFVSGYHLFGIPQPLPGGRNHDVFYPGWGNIRVQLFGDDWSVRIGERTFDPIPKASLFGPTCRASFSDAGGGRLVGAGLTPLGWAAFVPVKAHRVADRIAPLEEAFGEAADQLRQTLMAAPDDTAIGEAFDAFFLRRLGRRKPSEAIVAFNRLLVGRHDTQVSAVARQLGVAERTLTRISRAAFGFSPKLLLQRSRFLKSLIALRDGEGPMSTLIDPGYTDQSHFIRDAYRFLGMAPGEFLRLPKPMHDASTRLRRQMLGEAAQALHAPAG